MNHTKTVKKLSNFDQTVKKLRRISKSLLPLKENRFFA
jgi:hypothetical protein